MNDNTIKLQAFLSQAGIASRRKCETLIAEGKVVVNDEVAHIGQRIDPAKDTVVCKGETINSHEQKRYFLIDKPLGYVSTTNDEMGRREVTQLLPKEVKERLYPVGRLDIDSEGLLLLTNDGELAQKLTHPRYAVDKTYHVFTKRNPSFNAMMHLRKGVKLKEGYTNPATVERLSTDDEGTWIELIINEGRNHQVKRMMERVGYPIEKLVRMTMGPLNIDMLEGETVIELSTEQVAELKNFLNR
ncbi:rRNA pseudouridine synthase [Candidatus Woesebacteria bacterium]|nr:rRNA pseudouridine synthase [Candidatus Woesebacteria bacterium]